MHRFYVPPEGIAGDEITLSGAAVHHIRRVLRLKAHDELIIFDGAGREYLCELVSLAHNGVRLKIKKRRRNGSGLIERCRITLAQALPKRAKMDYIIQKAAELGAHSLIPMITERTIIKMKPADIERKIGRWKTIAQEAAAQSGNLYVTQLLGAETAEGVLKKAGDYELAIMFCLSKKAKGLKGILNNKKPNDILIMIGPEGDFSEREIDTAQKAGCELASLGDSILKVDTASIAALAILNYECLPVHFSMPVAR